MSVEKIRDNVDQKCRFCSVKSMFISKPSGENRIELEIIKYLNLRERERERERGVRSKSYEQGGIYRKRGTEA